MHNKRVCFVEVECIDEYGQKQLKQLSGLAIKGRVSRKAGTAKSEAFVQIANLNKATTEYLTTYTTPYFRPKSKKMINIYAGYEDTGWGRIFSGDITEAIPKSMPDVWLDIKAESLNYNQRVPVSFNLNGATSREIGSSIAQTLNLSYDWQATSQKTVDVFEHLGSKTELINKYNSLEDVIMFEDNGYLRVIDKKAVAPSDTKNVKLISKKTGLIGEIEPDKYGVKFKCFIDPSLNCGYFVRTESEKLPGTNGIYSVYTLDFDFASREQQFYCNVYAKTGRVI